MSHHILVVDDNNTNLNLVSKILKIEGYEVTTAASGLEALEKVNMVKYDLAVLDVMMPHMNGFELCRRMRQLPTCADIPIIMLTASSDEEDRIMGEKAGATAMLGKPFDVDALNKQIHKYLE